MNKDEIVAEGTGDAMGCNESKEEQADLPQQEEVPKKEDESDSGTEDDDEVDEVTAEEAANYQWWTPTDLCGYIDSVDLAGSNQLVDPATVASAANHLVCSHLHMAVGAAWFNRKNLIVWMDAPMEMVHDHKEAHREIWPRFRCDGTVARRKYSVMGLDSLFFGLAPAMQRFRLQPSCFWGKIGMHYRQGILPEIDPKRPIRWLELDYRKTLRPDTRFLLFSLIDKDFRTSLIPESNRRLVEAILHVYRKEEAIKWFPDLFVEKSWEDYAGKRATAGDTLHVFDKEEEKLK